ncbi:MAG: gamma carbonic anhydrase family protein, partial [Leucobacter sp.]
MALILPFNGFHPEIHPDAWLAPNATVIGDVRIGAGASVWFGAVLRGDMDRI